MHTLCSASRWNGLLTMPFILPVPLAFGRINLGETHQAKLHEIAFGISKSSILTEAFNLAYYAYVLFFSIVYI